MTLGVYIGSVSDTTRAIGDYYRARHVGLVTLRVGLDYGERVHRPITKFEPETRLHVRDNGRHGGRDGEAIRTMRGLVVLRRPCFLFRSLRLLKQLDLWRTPVATRKSVAMLATVSCFLSFVFEIPHRIIIDHSVKPWPTKNLFQSQSYCSIPLNFLTSALLLHSLNQP